MNDKTIRILLIEDNPGDVRLIREMLAEAKYITFDLECVDRLSTGLERYARGDIDLILLDLGLPDSQGLDTFAKINAQVSGVPIIVLTASEDDVWATKAVQEGAQDYLVKGKADNILLVRTIRYAIEHKKAEDALRMSEEYFKTLIEQSPIGIQIMTSDGRIVQVNDAYTKLWGISRKALEPTFRKYNIFKDEQIKKVGFMPYVKKAFSGESLSLPPFEYDPKKSLVARRGRKRWIRSHMYSIKDKNDQILNVITMYEDITERKRAEEKLKKYTETLEEMVEVRTNELQNTQKELARKEKLAILGIMAGGVGHDLRNPLSAIKSAAYFLNMALEAPDLEVKETLEILEKEVANSTAIISALLDFARSKPPSLRNTNINVVVQEALSPTVVPENVEVVIRLDERLPPILADPDQLVQVFSNIISNAIQAMPDGGVLTIKSEAPSPESVAISVSDTGMGIPDENMSKIFEPLFTTKAKGIGLGLAVAKTLVEAHGGTITVESEVGKGTTFTVKMSILGEK
jgi:PAS domain S-box-containing protein